jgi:Flp pilus assembly protein TadD
MKNNSLFRFTSSLYLIFILIFSSLPGMNFGKNSAAVSEEKIYRQFGETGAKDFPDSSLPPVDSIPQNTEAKAADENSPKANSNYRWEVPAFSRLSETWLRTTFAPEHKLTNDLLNNDKPGRHAQQGIEELEREFYALNTKTSQWEKIIKDNPRAILPLDFFEDLERRNHLAARLSLARAEVAQKVAEEETEKEGLREIVYYLRESSAINAATEVYFEAVNDNLKQQEDFYNDWLERTKDAQAIALTLDNAKLPFNDEQRKKVDNLRAEAALRKREISAQIEDIKNTQNRIKQAQNGLSAAFKAYDISYNIQNGEFFDGAGNAIDIGSKLAEIFYEEKQLKQISKRLELGQGTLSTIQNLSSGSYLDAALSAVKSINGFIKDYQTKEIKDTKGTLKLFMETSFKTPDLQKVSDRLIGELAEKNNSLQKIEKIKKTFETSEKVLTRLQTAWSVIKVLNGHVNNYRDLLNSSSIRTTTTANLIAGMSLVGDAINTTVSFMPPIMKETVGQFFNFYADALKAGQILDASMRKLLTERDQGLGVEMIGGLQHSVAGRYLAENHSGLLEVAKEFKDSGLRIFHIENTDIYYFVPDTNQIPLKLDADLYRKIAKICSNFSAYQTLLAGITGEKLYLITNEDLAGIIDSVKNNKGSFWVNDGWFSDSTYELDGTKVIVRVNKKAIDIADALIHIKAALGEQISKRNLEKFLIGWVEFTEDLAFQEKLCGSALVENDKQKHNIFIAFVENREAYKMTILRMKLTDPNCLARGEIRISGDTSGEVNSTINLTAELNPSLRNLEGIRLAWFNDTEKRQIGAGLMIPLRLEKEGSYKIRVEFYSNSTDKSKKLLDSPIHSVVAKLTPTTKPAPSPSPSPVIKTETETSKLMFGGTASDIWETVNDEKGFRMKRQIAKFQGTGDCSGGANVSAEIWGRINPSFAPTTPQKIADELQRIEAALKPWGKTTTARALTIGDFKGQFADTNLVFYRGGASPDSGYRDSQISAEGRGWLLSGIVPIEIGYNISGGGCYNNSDRAFLEKQANAAQSEAKAIINSLTLNGLFSKTPYKGPRLDGSDTPSVEIVLSPNKKKLKKGELINIQAVVKNASAEDQPISFTWTGDHAGKGANVQFLANKPGKQTLSVVAEGAKYPLGAVSVEFEVGDLRAEIRQISPQTSKVSVGVPVSFSAQLLSEGAALSGNYIYRFQPSPVVKFEANESAVKQTKAVFTQPGREKVWVQILEKKGEILETVAESEQIEIEVVAPELRISFDQQKPLVGKAVKAKVDVVPADLKNIDFRWEVSTNARQTLQTPDAKEITFVPQDAKPIVVKVYARVPVSGADLGTKEATISAQSFDVKVEVLGAQGTKPQIWKEGIGLVPLDTGIAVFQNVGLKAVVTPQAENLRYTWTVNEGSHVAGGSSSPDVTVNRSQTGICEATVVVRDKDGVEIGRGTGSFNVSVSQAELDKAKTLGGTTVKLAQAKDIIRKGQLDEAIVLVDEVNKLDPKNAEAATLSTKWKQEKATVLSQIEKTRALMKQQKFTEASNELIVAKNLHHLYPPLVAFEKEFNEKRGDYQTGVVTAMGNIRMASETRQYKKALDLAAELRAKYKLLPVTEKDLQNYEYWARTREAEKERQRTILKRGEEKYRNYDFAGAYEDLNVSFEKGDFYEHWNSNYDPEPAYYQKFKDDAFLKMKRINELLSNARGVAADQRLGAQYVQKAIADCDEILKIQPPNAEARNLRDKLFERLKTGTNTAKASEAVKRGEALHGERRYAEAIREFDSAITLDPSSADAYRRRAMSKRENADLKGSLNDFNKAIELDPKNYQTFLGRGILREKTGDEQGAMNDYTRGIELNPQYPNGYSYRGLLKINLKDYPGAIRDFDMAISLDPKNRSAYVNRGLAKDRSGDLQGAFRDYNEAIKIDPNYSLGYNNRGSTKEKLGDLQGALADFEKAVQLDPANELAKNNLAKLKGKLATNAPAFLKSGRYPMVANKFSFDLIITVTGNTFEGKDSVGSPIKNGIISGNTVKFHRVTPGIPQGQDYQGEVVQ